MKGSGEEARWRRWEVVRKGSGEEGKWTKGGGDDGKWWGREVVTKRGGDDGKWWQWEVVRKGSGDEGKWWNLRLHLRLQIALEWLHDVARALFSGGSRSTKPCVFPCKVAAAGDERYLVCAALRLRSVCLFFCRIVMVASSCVGCACACVVIGCFGICGCRSHCNGCMNVAWAMFGEEAGARNLVFFRVKRLQAMMKGTAAAVVPDAIGSFYVFCNKWLFLWCSSMRFLKLWLQIALEWLHECCMVYVFGEEAGARNLVFFRVKRLQATMKGTSCVRRVRLRSFRTRLVPSIMCCATSGCSCGVVLCVSWSCGCRSHCKGCMNVPWAMFWGGSRSTKPCVFPCKVAAGDDERYLVCATGAAAVVPDAIGSFYVFCNKWLFLWCRSMRFLKLWLQIALEWLHECCMVYVLGRKPEHETLCFSV